MSLNLSWRQKFLALIVVTPLGFLAIALAVIWGLESVSSSYRDAFDMINHQSRYGDLITRYNGVEKDLANFQSADRDAVIQRLDTFLAKAQDLSAQSKKLDDPAVRKLADQVSSQSRQYVEQRKTWIDELQTLGLTDEEGMRQTLTKALLDLKNLSISLFDETVEAVEQGKSRYINERDVTGAEGARQAISDLEALVKQYDWEDNVIGEKVKAYRKTFDQADNQMQALLAVDSQATASGEALQAAVMKLSETLHSSIVARSLAEAENAETSARWASLGTLGVFGPVLVIALFIASRTLVRRLQRTVEVLSGVSDGDLTQHLTPGKNPRDEFNQLASAVNQMIDNIGHLMRDAIGSTDSLVQVRQQLDQSMARLAANSDTVESQTVQAATASQQISVTLADVAQRTSQVGVSTQKANEAAQSGAEVIQKNMATMDSLSDLIQESHNHVKQLTQSSSRVTGIIDVINGLADQTNLLALNAAIEAARAGEAGRGFSVVADEVRTLAQKTVEATNSIVSIIDDLNKQTRLMDQVIGNGLKLVEESEASAGEIASAMGHVTESIASLTAEMDQVVVAVEEISTTTDDIAQKMEEIRHQSGESQTIGTELGEQNQRLADHAERLSGSTRRFRVA
ncbi:methyl-accepting chemotaxis protein [Marinobacter sp. JSM 1782161]|uniref:methyl-accepting chemotaxis protein n=1 Tax=Marinobacter sp. JSM 1782161 TaxID=2685906 RepID=UPI00140243D5|nr:methyl-accepting chemotaxis protein [Marinobacter sp. JSM 1782161]